MGAAYAVCCGRRHGAGAAESPHVLLRAAAACSASARPLQARGQEGSRPDDITHAPVVPAHALLTSTQVCGPGSACAAACKQHAHSGAVAEYARALPKPTLVPPCGLAQQRSAPLTRAPRGGRSLRAACS
jgi:hypothetical protein